MSLYYTFKLPYGLRKLGAEEKLIHISEILPHESGLNCNCVCPQCGVALQAKLPKTKEDFTARFAHHNAETCKYATETAIHMKAKEIIDAAKYVILPEVNASYNGLHKLICKEKEIIFDRVELEHRIDNIIPDVVAYKNDRPLLIEIKITHGIDNEKFEKIKALDISTIEIDLSDMDLDFNPETLYEEVITKTDRKMWIYNAIKENAVEELKREFEEKQEKIRQKQEALAKSEEEKRINRIQRVKQLTDDKYQQEMRRQWANEFHLNPIWKKHAGWMNISKVSIPVYLNLEIPGDFVFGCDRRVWQTFIFQKFINNKVKMFKDKICPITVKRIIETVKKEFKSYLKYELVYLRDINEFRNVPDLTDVVYAYLKRIEEYGYLSEIPTAHIFYSKFEILDPNSVYEVRMVPSTIPEYETIVDYLERRDRNGCKKYLTELLIKYNQLNHFEFSNALGRLFNTIA